MSKIKLSIRQLTVCLFLLAIFAQFLSAQSPQQVKLTQKAYRKLENWDSYFQSWQHLGNITIDSISVLPQKLFVQIFFSKTLSYIPVREEIYHNTVRSIKDQLGRVFRKYEIRLYTDGQLFKELVPNYFRKDLAIDSSRLSIKTSRPVPLIRKIGESEPEYGLYNRIIALWPSHGIYYESKLDRWEWQRARLHTTVEDIFPMTFVLPYLVPMLENAGTTLFLPRERDIQINEIIVDNDFATANSFILTYGLEPDTISGYGFAWSDTLISGENPFKMGSHLRFSTTNNNTGFLRYIPEIPEDGDYAVYISYAKNENNVSDVKYSVFHTGGKAKFMVNQQMGAGTWIYLGTFYFNKGINQETASVVISSENKNTGWISSDAIRFGGGMGTVARRPSEELVPNQWSLKEGQNQQSDNTKKINPDNFQWKLSQKPRYLEAARYYLQYAGMPDTLVYSLNSEKNDYNDDYQSRGEWVNYLMGSPNGPINHRKVSGLNIPIDMAFAFHTDAGVTPNDSIIGTLGIYSSITNNGLFPNGQSKMASRDLSDIIQTQVVNDIRFLFNPDWTRRGLWNKKYSEAWRPNVPVMLLELMSHQNLADMQMGLDPRFRFAVSRSIYKGMLKFLTGQEGQDYVVQPLPVDYFSISHINGKTIRLSWKPVVDPLEPTAIPNKYKLYKRVGNSGFDNGIIVEDTSIILTLNEYDLIYSFKVCAINNGGESFPSEILSAGFNSGSDKIVLVVNSFDRVCGPVIIDNKQMAGIAWWDDQGVPYKYELGHTGVPYDFSRQSPWLDDDSPGWGASYGDNVGKIIPGNSFDYSYVHGEAIMAAGYSFISMSDEAFANTVFDPKPYNFVDIIYGEEKTTYGLKDHSRLDFEVFTPEIRHKIKVITGSGGNVFISGAYIASDFKLSGDTITRNFAKNVLHYTWRTDHAVKSGEVYATDYARKFFKGQWTFNTTYHPDIYTVEAPDAIEPFGNGAITAFRYRENNSSAGILFNGNYKTVVLGFPFETILEKDQRITLMKQVIGFFENNRKSE